MVELAFVLSSRQHRSFAELVNALGDELRDLGVSWSVSTTGLPPPGDGLVYVLVQPHDCLGPSGDRPPAPPLLRRSVLLCAEAPGTSHFAQVSSLAPLAGSVLHLDPSAAALLDGHGTSVSHLPLGYAKRWDGSPLDGPREVDLLSLGAPRPRHMQVLGDCAPALSDRRCVHVLSLGTEVADPLTGDLPGLLRRSRLLLHALPGDYPYADRLHLVEAVCSGAVIVSEHVPDLERLRAGAHYVSARAAALPAVLRTLLVDDELRGRIQEDALQALRAEPTMREAAERLVEAAERVERTSPVPVGGDRLFAGFTSPPAVRPGMPEGQGAAAAQQRAIKQLRLEVVETRRELARLRLRLEGRPETVEVLGRTEAWQTATPRVTVVVPVYNYARYVAHALDTIAASTHPSFEIVVVDDSSTDGSVAAAAGWCDDHPPVPCLLVGHPYNRGVADARNTGIAHARGEFVFLLDADDELYPHALARLVEALDADPAAAFAYGIAERFDASGRCFRLDSIWPWDPSLFRFGNYIAVSALIRTGLLRDVGMFTTDRRFMGGWEDYELWCRLAALGHRGRHVPEILARFRVTGSSRTTLVDLSHAELFDALSELYPAVLGADDLREAG